MKRKHKRLTFVIVAMALLAVAAGLILSAFEDNIVFFYSPTDVAGKKIAEDRRIRLGGLVEEGSVKKTGGAIVTFRVTDLTTVIAVTYKGLLPDLFREGQGVIAEGRLKGGVFQADEVLAKHDETYMPSEVADALKKSGQWKGKMENKKKSERLY
ncbi:MAG: cytochrome c maturation protein CcmE [Rhodospirillales bacterium]